MSENKNGKVRSILFALVLCFVCSLILIAASNGLKGRQQKNLLVDRQTNILKSAGLIKEDDYYNHQLIESIFKKKIKSYFIDPSGHLLIKENSNQKLLKIYLHIKDGIIESYILPIDSRGLWGKILGYLALKNDGSTVTGFTVYSHSETPGLGGEIESRWFRKNFAGKKIVDKENNFVSIVIAKGNAPKKGEDNYVDGISGATLTGKFLTKGLKNILLEYEPVSIRFRSGLIKNRLSN